uniref:Transposable element Tc1 transposase n=1 Tax=Ceratitis capitata TaxID=7213 RepID=W8AML4_CERCA
MTVKHGGGSVMVWGCMSAARTGNLCFINGKLDHKQYLTILKENLVQSAEKLGIKDNFQYCQPNDPKHKALDVRLWLMYNCLKVLETPPQSPDIYIIEHLWAHLENKLKMHVTRNKKDLEAAILEEWGKINT